MTLADGITLSRVLLTPVVMVLWISPHLGLRLVGLVVFIVAGLTDYVDGRVARAQKTTTKLGGYLDPLADKVLVLGAGMALVSVGLLLVWWLLVVLLRELAVTGLRSVLQSGSHMPASVWSKWKTTVQMVALGASAVLHGVVPNVLWAIAVILTIGTGVEYFQQNWQYVK